MTRNCCPQCSTVLDGGPIEFRCSHCIRTVYAADLDLEYHAPRTPATTTLLRTGT